MMKVAIIGLGYVGLPLALLASKQGYSVEGYDLNTEHIELLKKGITTIKDEDISSQLAKQFQSMKFFSAPNEHLSEADYIIICVPTPVDEHHKPLMNYVISATETVSEFLRVGQTIILESTVFPGTMDSIVKPILERKGLKAGIDFQLSYCPERIDPGNKKWNVSNIPRVLGSYSTEGAKHTKSLYASLITAGITILKSPKEAEATKIMENTFRDINIAFINEMARSFDKMDIDILEVIKGATTKPFSFMPHFPGCGVGGHCIPVDPYYLIEDAKSRGFDHKFLSLAREINEDMPNYTIELLDAELEKKGLKFSDVRIGVYGITYKKNVNDIRESPSLKILSLFEEKGVNVAVFDPFYTKKNTHNDFEHFLSKSDVLIVATDHDEITSVSVERFQTLKIIIDGRNCLNKSRIVESGIAYKGIGR